MGGYQVIKFTAEDAVEVVPSAWLFQEGEEKMCWWPNTPSQSALSMAIKSQKVPEDSWKKYKVATRATYTSCLESDECAMEEIKRPRKRNQKYVSSSEEDDNLFLPRKSPRYKMKTPVKYPTPPNNHETDNSRSSSQVIPSRVLQVKSNLEEKLVANVKNLSKSTENTGKCSSCIKNEDLFAQVIRLLHIVNGKVAQNTELITTLLNSNKESLQNEIIPENEIDLNIPAISYTSFMELDKKLEDVKFKQFLVKKLVHVGGESVKEVVKRILPRIVDDNVLRQFSWVGGKGKKIFSHLNVANIIKEVCNQNRNTHTASEKVVEQVVAIFLTKATERCNRRMSKENKPEQDVDNENEDLE